MTSIKATINPEPHEVISYRWDGENPSLKHMDMARHYHILQIYKLVSQEI